MCINFVGAEKNCARPCNSVAEIPTSQYVAFSGTGYYLCDSCWKALREWFFSGWNKGNGKRRSKQEENDKCPCCGWDGRDISNEDAIFVLCDTCYGYRKLDVGRSAIHKETCACSCERCGGVIDDHDPASQSMELDSETHLLCEECMRKLASWMCSVWIVLLAETNEND